MCLIFLIICYTFRWIAVFFLAKNYFVLTFLWYHSDLLVFAEIQLDSTFKRINRFKWHESSEIFRDIYSFYNVYTANSRGFIFYQLDSCGFGCDIFPLYL